MSQQNLQPVPASERRLGSFDLAILWFGAAIAITEIWAGGQAALTAVGLGAGLLAILLGRILGNGLMAAMARIGAQSGLPTMLLSRPALGVRGSQLLSVLNVLQLLGWTGFMIFVGVIYLDTLALQLGLPGVADSPAMRLLWTSLLTVLCTMWAYFFARRKAWVIIERVSGALLLLLSIAMTVAVISTYGVSGFMAGSGGSFLPAMDLVVVMSVSWLPLVADYSSHAKSARAGAAGTFWGYFAGGTWMYAVGLLVALAGKSAEPEVLVLSAMGSQGARWAVLAIVLVLLSTVTTTFLDIYSAVISAQNTGLSLSPRVGTIIVGAIGGLLALGLDAYAYSPFLIAIGAVFLPAFVVVLAEYYLFGGRPELAPRELRGWNSAGVIAWAIGFIVFDAASGWTSLGYFAGLLQLKLSGTAWPLGASLPCIAATLLSTLLLRKLAVRRAP